MYRFNFLWNLKEHHWNFTQFWTHRLQNMHFTELMFVCDWRYRCIIIWILVPCDIVHWSVALHHSLLDWVLGCALLWCWVPLCVPFTNSLIWFYFIMIVVTFIVMFRFSTRIFYRGVPGSVTDCSCGVWCRGLTTCLLYVGPLFWKSSLKW